MGVGAPIWRGELALLREINLEGHFCGSGGATFCLRPPGASVLDALNHLPMLRSGLTLSVVLALSKLRVQGAPDRGCHRCPSSSPQNRNALGAASSQSRSTAPRALFG